MNLATILLSCIVYLGAGAKAFKDIFEAREYFETPEFHERLYEAMTKKRCILEEFKARNPVCAQLYKLVRIKVRELMDIADEGRKFTKIMESDEIQNRIDGFGEKLQELRSEAAKLRSPGSIKHALDIIGLSLTPESIKDQIYNFIKRPDNIISLALLLVKPEKERAHTLGRREPEKLEKFVGKLEVDLDLLVERMIIILNQQSQFSHKILIPEPVKDNVLVLKIPEIMCMLGLNHARELFFTFTSEAIGSMQTELDIQPELVRILEQAIRESKIGEFPMNRIYHPKNPDLSEALKQEINNRIASCKKEFEEELEELEEDSDQAHQLLDSYLAEKRELKLKLKEIDENAKSETSVSLLLILMMAWRPLPDASSLSYVNLYKVYWNIISAFEAEVFGRFLPKKDFEVFPQNYASEYEKLRCQIHKNLAEFSTGKTRDPVRITALKSCIFVLNAQFERLIGLIDVALDISISDYGWTYIAWQNYIRLFEKDIGKVANDFISDKSFLNNPFRNNQSDAPKLLRLREMVEGFIKILYGIDITIKPSELTIENPDEHAEYLGEHFVPEKVVTEKASEAASE